MKELSRYRLSSLLRYTLCKNDRLGAISAERRRAEIAAINDPEAACWGGVEHLLIRVAEQMSLSKSDGVISAELHAEFDRHFNNAQILELGGTMSGPLTCPGIFGPGLMFIKGTGDVDDGEAEIHDRGDHP